MSISAISKRALAVSVGVAIGICSATGGLAAPVFLNSTAVGWYPYWPLGTGQYFSPGFYGYSAGFYGPGYYTRDYFAPAYAPVAGSRRQNWNAYCLAKYRSFNLATGTYLGYDGFSHPCR